MIAAIAASGGTAAGGGSSKFMARTTVIDRRIRVVLVVMLAVVASMTMHHGAMASDAGRHGYSSADLQHRVSDTDCDGDCTGEAHELLACCGTGMCMSGLPIAQQAAVRPVPKAPIIPNHVGIDPRWTYSRIDRPPKPELVSV
ncbi:hypothetical protein WH91_02495 [Devosia psychrophila]|uniref:Uncharacterized protein n=1 Tax=Devosia psychrophila TaxID=728005 RepID=A0ABR5E2R1_9HYPH|nr:hypothetical protein WH91_02495 [Devosia psychrophila]